MRTIGIIVVAMLTCSCHKVDSKSNSYDNIQKRYDEIRMIMKDYYRKEAENSPYSYKIAPEDYDAVYSEYVFRGPLTREQFEQELLERLKNPLLKLDIPLLNKYQEGDEFYYFELKVIMGGSKGYVLIRDNEFIGEYITEVRM